MSSTLETLCTMTRKGYGDRPNLELVLTVEQYDGSRFIQLDLKTNGTSGPKNRVTIRQKEIPTIIEALSRGIDRICDDPDSFTEGMSHAEYAASPACPF